MRQFRRQLIVTVWDLILVANGCAVIGYLMRLIAGSNVLRAIVTRILMCLIPCIPFHLCLLLGPHLRFIQYNKVGKLSPLLFQEMQLLSRAPLLLSGLM